MLVSKNLAKNLKTKPYSENNNGFKKFLNKFDINEFDYNILKKAIKNNVCDPDAIKTIKDKDIEYVLTKINKKIYSMFLFKNNYQIYGTISILSSSGKGGKLIG